MAISSDQVEVRTDAEPVESTSGETSSNTAPTFDLQSAVDALRLSYESDEHWTLRRKFLVANWGKVPKGRLILLSNVFANHEIMACEYEPKALF